MNKTRKKRREYRWIVLDIYRKTYKFESVCLDQVKRAVDKQVAERERKKQKHWNLAFHRLKASQKSIILTFFCVCCTSC